MTANQFSAATSALSAAGRPISSLRLPAGAAQEAGDDIEAEAVALFRRRDQQRAAAAVADPRRRARIDFQHDPQPVDADRHFDEIADVLKPQFAESPRRRREQILEQFVDGQAAIAPILEQVVGRGGIGPEDRGAESVDLLRGRRRGAGRPPPLLDAARRGAAPRVRAPPCAAASFRKAARAPLSCPRSSPPSAFVGQTQRPGFGSLRQRTSLTIAPSRSPPLGNCGEPFSAARQRDIETEVG